MVKTRPSSFTRNKGLEVEMLTIIPFGSESKSATVTFRTFAPAMVSSGMPMW